MIRLAIMVVGVITIAGWIGIDASSFDGLGDRLGRTGTALQQGWDRCTSSDHAAACLAAIDAVGDAALGEGSK